MTWMAATLWDLIAPGNGSRRQMRRERPAPPPCAVAPAVANHPNGLASSLPTGARVTMQDRYDALVEEMKSKHGVRVRKWRKSSSGVAWMIRYRDGGEVKLIESPYPRGPMSCAIFLHEVGHHAIGLGIHRPRCLEEYHVWEWALRAMRERGLNVTPAVEKRMHDSLEYAVRKAKRRGLRALPAELKRYT